jgi:DNA polymerase III delta subunit
LLGIGVNPIPLRPLRWYLRAAHLLRGGFSFAIHYPILTNMIIFLYGPDDYRRAEKKRSVIAEFVKKRGDLGLATFDLEEKTAFEALADFLKTQSLFESAKLAVLENAFEIEAPKLSKLLKPFLEEKNITVLIAEKDKPVKALAFLIDKPAISQKFETLVGVEWLSFVNAAAKANGAKLSLPAARFLADVYQGNSWGLVTELEKLAGLGKGKAATIERADLDQFDLEVAPNYWGLMNGLKSYELKNRLYALETMLALSDPPAKIFNILASQWAEKTPHMAEYDLAVKSGKVDYEEALVDLLVS